MNMYFMLTATKTTKQTNQRRSDSYKRHS